MKTREIVNRTCPFCGRISRIELDTEKLDRWDSGENLQDVFPDMDLNTREILISGIDPECWDRLFG